MSEVHQVKVVVKSGINLSPELLEAIYKEVHNLDSSKEQQIIISQEYDPEEQTSSAENPEVLAEEHDGTIALEIRPESYPDCDVSDEIQGTALEETCTADEEEVEDNPIIQPVYIKKEEMLTEFVEEDVDLSIDMIEQNIEQVLKTEVTKKPVEDEEQETESSLSRTPVKEEKHRKIAVCLKSEVPQDVPAAGKPSKKTNQITSDKSVKEEVELTPNENTDQKTVATRQKVNNNSKRKSPPTEKDDDNITSDVNDDANKQEASKKPKRKKRQKPDRVTCEKCSQSYCSAFKLKKHKCNTDTPRKNLRCPECDKMFHKQTSIDLHLSIGCASPSSNSTYQCPECGKELVGFSKLETHVRIHTKKEMFECPHCEKQFTQKANRDSHVRGIHLNQRPHLCNLCGKGFSQKIGLEYHLSVHADDVVRERCHLCSECGKVFPTLAHLEHHLTDRCDSRLENATSIGANNSDESVFGFVCVVCNRRFWRAARWLYHMQAHLEDENLPPEHEVVIEEFLSQNEDFLEKCYKEDCSECGQRFFNATELRKHQAVHRNELPYKCRHCKMGFADEKQKIRHQATHPEEFQFGCPFCDKCYRKGSYLRQHISAKHGNQDMPAIARPRSCLINGRKNPNSITFDCSFCDRSFKRKYNKIVHERTHTKETPFVCPVCSKAFSDPANMRHHGRKVHPNEPLERFSMRSREKISYINVEKQMTPAAALPTLTYSEVELGEEACENIVVCTSTEQLEMEVDLENELKMGHQEETVG